MLIVSKKKDYYDGVVGTMGVDKTIVYDRQEQVFENSNDFPQIFRKTNKWAVNDSKCSFSSLSNKFTIKKEYSNIYTNLNYFIIGFCGKLYFGLRLFSKNEYNHEKLNKIVYDETEILEIISEYRWSRKDYSINIINNYDPIDIHRRFNSPIFVFDDGKFNDKFIINPLLKEYEFFKIFDSFLAFQEIQMFLGGVLGSNENDIIKIEDKYKIQQHGFDKWSFRKEPTKNKK